MWWTMQTTPLARQGYFWSIYMKGSLTLIEKSSNDSLLPDGISRRDFVNGTLVDFGTALLTSNIPAIADSNVTLAVFSDPCSGYGGIGDYANSNGNVCRVYTSDAADEEDSGVVVGQCQL